MRCTLFSLLISADEAEFPYIKEQTGATAGNLSVQLEKLSAAGYITKKTDNSGQKPRTTCSMTHEGREAMLRYVDALKTYFTGL